MLFAFHPGQQACQQPTQARHKRKQESRSSKQERTTAPTRGAGGALLRRHDLPNSHLAQLHLQVWPPPVWKKAIGLAKFAEDHSKGFGRLIFARYKGEKWEFAAMCEKATLE
jgi:hypothetical protein